MSTKTSASRELKAANGKFFLTSQLFTALEREAAMSPPEGEKRP